MLEYFANRCGQPACMNISWAIAIGCIIFGYRLASIPFIAAGCFLEFHILSDQSWFARATTSVTIIAVTAVSMKVVGA